MSDIIGVVDILIFLNLNGKITNLPLF